MMLNTEQDGLRPDSTENSSAEILAETLSKLRTRKWLFVKPGGNWGDHLIYLGAEKLARAAGLQWDEVDFSTFPDMAVPENACIYLHGGGGLNSWGSGRAFQMLARAASVPGAVVIQGPQTCEVDNPVVAECFAQALGGARCAELTVFARERTSFRYMRSVLPPEAGVKLAHDTALTLEIDDLLRFAELSRRPAPRYDLLVSREDDEVPKGPAPTGWPGLELDPATYARTFAHWVRIHLFASSITTNRLHSAIFGVIAGIPVTLLPGSYHKNRSVWEHSLQGRAQWSECLSEPLGKRLDVLAMLPAFLRRSWKVRHLMMRLKGMPGA